jgi:hypothetical protein
MVASAEAKPRGKSLRRGPIKGDGNGPTSRNGDSVPCVPGRRVATAAAVNCPPGRRPCGLEVVVGRQLQPVVEEWQPRAGTLEVDQVRGESGVSDRFLVQLVPCQVALGIRAPEVIFIWSHGASIEADVALGGRNRWGFNCWSSPSCCCPRWLTQSNKQGWGARNETRLPKFTRAFTRHGHPLETASANEGLPPSLQTTNIPPSIKFGRNVHIAVCPPVISYNAGGLIPDILPADLIPAPEAPVSLPVPRPWPASEAEGADPGRVRDGR